jgi:shikimate dehydrogenase
MSINNLIENKINDLNQTENYVAIFGLSPSKGARSPKLWNAAFDGLKISGYMYPFDVLPNNLGKLIDKLRLDNRFLGGSVAVPYKTNILKYLDGIEEEAETIGAVNCIYRDSNGKLIGTNTDGAGALWSLQSVYGNIIGTKVLILGAGGAAAAVAAYVGKAIGKNGKLLIANRNDKKTEELTQKLINICEATPINWPVNYDNVRDIDIIINCTSIGFDAPLNDQNGYYTLKYYSPLGIVNDNTRVLDMCELDQGYVYRAAKNISKNFYETKIFLSQFKNLFVFDIVYQPHITCLLFISNLIGHKILTGNGMNLEQAVIAFDKTTSSSGKRNSDQSEVRRHMIKVT